MDDLQDVFERPEDLPGDLVLQVRLSDLEDDLVAVDVDILRGLDADELVIIADAVSVALQEEADAPRFDA